MRAAAGAWLVAALCLASCAQSDPAPSGPDPNASLVPAVDSSQPTGGACVDTVCPAPFATCPGAGPCTVNLQSDIAHCGSCTTSCPATTKETHGTYLCAGGACRVACDAFYADCNGVLADGCETSTFDDPQNCGGCGKTCKTGELCWRGACGCPNGFTQCGTECRKLDADDANCGACGAECVAPPDGDPRWICGPRVTPANTKWRCTASSCQLQCAPGFADCNKSFCGDGCEIDLLNDPANCGSCGNQCAAGQRCKNGACQCAPGMTDCDGLCVDLKSDPNHCGRCDKYCPGLRSYLPGRPVTGGPACTDGKCSYVCKPGYANCDRKVDNGCEVDLNTDQNHCGSCENSCKVGAGQPCVRGACLTKPCETR